LSGYPLEVAEEGTIAVVPDAQADEKDVFDTAIKESAGGLDAAVLDVSVRRVPEPGTKPLRKRVFRNVTCVEYTGHV